MKNLANCKPSEFFIQTNKIRKSVAKWLKATDVVNILKTHAKTQDEKEIKEQFMKNVNSVMDNIFDKHPEETLELLALCCFVEPEDVDNHEVAEYLGAFNELISNKSVVDFFISLIKLGQMNISNAQ